MPAEAPIIRGRMVVPASDAWKVVLAVSLVGGIFVSVRARAPRRSLPRADLGRLVLAALLLYGVGVAASLTRHEALASVLYAAGISVCTLAVWLSRGSDPQDPPGRGDPFGDDGPPDPGEAPEFDWGAFEREFRAYERRARRPAGRR